MSQNENAVSASIEAEKAQELLGRIEALRAELPFLISLDSDDKASLLKPGARGLEGAAAVAELAEQNPAFFPASLMDAAELRADLELGRQLGPMARALRSLADALDDTVLAANSDAYRAALKGYALAKLAAKSLPGMDAKLEPLAEIFDRRRRKKSASDPA